MTETRFLYDQQHSPEENIAWLVGDDQHPVEESWGLIMLRTTTLTLTLSYLLHLARSI